MYDEYASDQTLSHNLQIVSSLAYILWMYERAQNPRHSTITIKQMRTEDTKLVKSTVIDLMDSALLFA